MPFPRKRKALQFSDQELRILEFIRKSRTDEKRRTQRAAFLLDSAAGQSDEAIARHHRVSRSTVVLCIQKAESPRGVSPRGAHRSGREPLDSSGSCHRVKAAAFRQDRRFLPLPVDLSISTPVTCPLPSTGITPLLRY